MSKFQIALVIGLLVFAWYLSFLASRLDRLHHRVETSWATLDSLLQRRAAIAIEIAGSDIADPASSLLLTFAAHQARDANVKHRSQAETGLTGALSILLESSGDQHGEVEKELIKELSEITATIKVAVGLHVESVERTRLIRKKKFIRLFRLAGHAPLPVTYEFEADVF